MTERDPALERAWRAQSRESPPPALDRAILAAAHRAVASRPQDAEKTPAATRPQRWWMPLAAAATIGVVAVGVMQSLPDEQLVSSAPERTAAMNERRIEEKPATPAPAESPNAVTPRDAQPEAKRDGAAKLNAEFAQKKKQEAPAAAPAQSPSPRGDATLADKGVAAVTGKLASAPEPFPAAPVISKTEADSAKGAMSGGASGAPAADAVAQSTRPAPAMQSEERKDAMAERQQPASTTAARAMAPSPPVAMAKRARESGDARNEPGAAEANQPAKNSADGDEYRAKARDPDAWIVQIKKLRDEGRTADALRELREFRARVPDAERRLPADLRDWPAAAAK